MTAATMSVKGTLVDGVVYEGLVHVDFEIRAVVVEDQLAAIEAVAAESTELDADKGVRDARTRVATLVSQLVFLGTIPREALTYAWLRNVLSPDDVDILFEKAEEAAKKRRAQPKANATT
ncbi:hypothetical protein HF908_08860 [Ralstonia pseudosolanacearum]|uniref:hypothetical protein n=1 Tax=Ralstonia pseudosolanacearum TaxID=1310165 RepID=UPI0018679A2B|nr:hypothetical protein [Ralstonia pseudosolanacearum]QOK91578.1 hypothetical protein HF908_08860 [Ralstonia pseudosolanacearum]